MNNWLLLAAVAGLASSGFNITNRVALKDDDGDATSYGWWFELVRTTFFIIIYLLNRSTRLTVEMLSPLLLVGLSELFSVYVYMKMHASTHLSISSVLIRLRVIFSPLLAWFLVGERLSLYEYLGILIIFLGIAVVTSPKEIKADKGIKIALIFSFSSAILSTMIKHATAVAPSDLIIIAQGIIPLIVLPILMKQGSSRIWQTASTRMPQIAIAGSFNIASSFLLVEAMHLTDASKAVGVYQALTLASVFYGIYILNERDRIKRKVIGAIIVLAGVIAVVI